MDCDKEFDLLFEKSKTYYDKPGIKEGYTNNKRTRKVPAALQKCVIDQFKTKPVSDN